MDTDPRGMRRQRDRDPPQRSHAWRLFLAVELRHRGLWVARADSGIFWYCKFDGGEILRGESDIERAERLGQPVAAPRTDQRNDVRSLLNHPGDGHLRDAHALGGSDLAQRVDQREVGVDVASLEPRAVRAEVAGGDALLAPV